MKNIEQIKAAIEEKFGDTHDEVYEIVDVDGEQVLYFCETYRGGRSMLVQDSGSFLFWDSSVNYDKAMEEYRNGRRSGVFFEL